MEDQQSKTGKATTTDKNVQHMYKATGIIKKPSVTKLHRSDQMQIEWKSTANMLKDNSFICTKQMCINIYKNCLVWTVCLSIAITQVYAASAKAPKENI